MAEQFTGDIEVRDDRGRLVFALNASAAHLELGTDGVGGDLALHDRSGVETFEVRGGNVRVGPVRGSSRGGMLQVSDEEGDTVFQLNSDLARLSMRRAQIFGADENGRNRLILDGSDGRLLFRDAERNMVFLFRSEDAALRLGITGKPGELSVKDHDDNDAIWMGAEHALLHVGAEGNEGDIRVLDGDGEVRIHLDGASGDVKLHGADCAEWFDVVDAEPAPEPGTLMVVGEGGRLCESGRAYDRSVAGVVSGAGDLKPGVLLGDRPSQRGSDQVPLSVAGRTYCKADARSESIRAGDLLTTATTPGHAMRADDPRRAFGAVVGKALRPLDDGQGLVPIVVALQ